MNIFTAILLGVVIAIAGYMWYLLYYIIKNLRKRVNIDWSKVKDVSVVDIKSRKGDIIWTRKIAFGENQIYLGYQKIGNTDSLPHACIATVKDGKRVGLALWKTKSNFNSHKVTLNTIKIATDGIVNDLFTNTNPMYDIRLERTFSKNGWK